MDLRSIVLDSLRSERRRTRETIAAMTDGDVSFRPTEQQLTFGGQALHIISCQKTLLDALQGKGWNWQTGIDLENYPTQAAILGKLDEITQAELSYYESLEPEEFGRVIQTAWGTSESLLSLVYSFLAHEAHHRGQMVVYLRMKGMTPPEY